MKQHEETIEEQRRLIRELKAQNAELLDLLAQLGEVVNAINAKYNTSERESPLYIVR